MTISKDNNKMIPICIFFCECETCEHLTQQKACGISVPGAAACAVTVHGDGGGGGGDGGGDGNSSMTTVLVSQP